MEDQRNEKLAETTDPTTDRHGHDGLSRDGPSQTRRTVVSLRFKTLQLLKIGYWEQFSELRDGSAGRTVVGTTDRHRHDGPSQVA
ncbi:hypothetical protein EJD97_024555 [Solanum chilense]|uniref:Uncharacterized protein n=1 Tax=Solanum chilense TaxID=4083 RepID=A0A6N2AYK3_SOLCI|nr:hypothetical protein EJD97_024555 [Solanum chilense]